MSHASTLPAPATFAPSGPLTGTVRVPGDKSISHRSLMLSALAVGESRVTGLLEGEDVMSTAAAMRAMGATIIPPHGGGAPSPDAGIGGGHAGQGGTGMDRLWTIHGVGVGGLLQPQTALDMGNSGTSTRLLMGLVASHAITATFIGDASLSKRPMGRVIDPLSLMGASFSPAPGGRLPLTMTGLVPAVPLSYRLPVASAQVKSAILLAGLNTPGITEVIEPVPTRDHSERMLRGFGADLSVEVESDGTRIIRLTGEAELKPQTIDVPGDPSSAAFPVVAALITPGSHVRVTNVGMNPTRAGIFKVLVAMGADLTFENERDVGGEPVADIVARHSVLTGIDVPPEVAPSMIDEYPIFFVAAAMAQGVTHAHGLDELRVKESDRLAIMAGGLARLGVHLDEREDAISITGSGGEPLAGGNGEVMIHAELDHRIAMSFAIAGLNTRGGLTIDDMSPVATSFPTFQAMLRDLAGSQ